MIARIWRGRTAPERGDEYMAYLERTGLLDYRRTPGNRGVLVLRRTEADAAEFLLISFWEDFDAIRRFAGESPELAVYYPQDDEFLLEREPRVAHYEVAAGNPFGAESR